ncbi:MAG TPA: hypothetical protein VJ862_03555 [Rhodanobacteraceae bacterium]|nr:hypothetical protein [Rhodanobacteraceae bacterium]
MHIHPGKRTRKTYIERFNKTYRPPPDCYVFTRLNEMRRMTEDSRYRHNHNVFIVLHRGGRPLPECNGTITQTSSSE